jgi:hypothetical protein
MSESTKLSIEITDVNYLAGLDKIPTVTVNDAATRADFIAGDGGY